MESNQDLKKQFLRQTPRLEEMIILATSLQTLPTMTGSLPPIIPLAVSLR